MSKCNTEDKLTAPDVCRCIHVALRKACDSRLTSTIYQAIAVVCERPIRPLRYDPWRIFGQMVLDNLTDERPARRLDHASAAVRAGIKQFTNDNPVYAAKEREEKENQAKGRLGRTVTIPEGAHERYYLLKGLFEMVLNDDDDVEGMASYLVEG